MKNIYQSFLTKRTTLKEEIGSIDQFGFKIKNLLNVKQLSIHFAAAFDFIVVRRIFKKLRKIDLNLSKLNFLRRVKNSEHFVSIVLHTVGKPKLNSVDENM